MTATSKRRGFSRALAAVALAAVLVLAFAVYTLGGSGSSSGSSSITASSSPTTTSSFTTTSSTTTSSANQSAPLNTTLVLSEVGVFESDFDSRDVSSLSHFYTPTSVSHWFGQTDGFEGVYEGAGNIELAYAATVGYATTMTASFTDVKTTVVGPDQVNLTSVVMLKGNSRVVGVFNGTVDIEQEWVLSGGALSIQKEDWNYTRLTVSDLSDSTVFPQWGLQLSGVNPNLAQMHVTEWDYAPYAAAAVYVGLAAVLAAALWAASRRETG